MARIKATYGKRPKTNTTFASSTSFWSSPKENASDSKYANADTFHDLPGAIGDLDMSDKRESRKKEKRERALQAIDGNAPSTAVTKSEKTGRKANVTESQEEEAPAPPKTPHRVKKAMSRKAAEEAEQTPRSERRRRGKRDIPTICLDSDNDATAPTTQPAKQSRRKRAMSSPQPAPLEPPKTATTTTTTTQQRRSKSPAVLITPKPSPDPLVRHTKPLLRLCADRRGRKAPTPFSLWAAALEPYFTIIKIAEASYGEVYRLSLKTVHPGLSASDESVLKIIALKPPEATTAKKGGKKTKAQRALEEKIAGMSAVEAVAGEIKLLQRMAHVPGFTNFRDVRVLQGAPPASFAAAWRAWNEGREGDKRSIFPDPGVPGSYDAEQLWAVVEMQDAGTDLENVGMADVGGVFAAWDVFWSAALALAKGEEEARFEHRDLHMGNICIRPADASRPIATPATVRHVARNLGFTGLETTIIDYTLSRAQLTHPQLSPDPEEREIAFLDLEEDPAVFEGDAEEEYQYEIYRYMRGAMYLDDPLADVDERWEEVEERGRTWVGFHPQTNVVWLHFILHEMMKQMVPVEKDAKKKKKGGGKEAKSKKKAVVPDADDEEEEEKAAFEELLAGKRKKLEKVLKKLQKLLDPERFEKSGLRSAKDLVALALEETWLDEEDVVAGSEGTEVEEGEGSLLELVRAMGI